MIYHYYQKSAKTNVGRPPHQVTKANRQIALKLASSGLRQADIAAVFNITVRTLRKWYRAELQAGSVAAVQAGCSPLYFFKRMLAQQRQAEEEM